MEIKTIQNTIRRAIQEYSMESELYDTDILVSFISVDLYRELNSIKPLGAVVVKTVETVAHRSTRRKNPVSVSTVPGVSKIAEVSEDGGEEDTGIVKGDSGLDRVHGTGHREYGTVPNAAERAKPRL